MKIVIDNLAKVSHADIEVDAISVIAGVNSTGKSTICRGVMTVSNVCRQMGFLVQEEKARSLWKLFREQLLGIGYGVFTNRQSDFFSQRIWLPWLSKEVWQDKRSIMSLFTNYQRIGREETVPMVFPPKVSPDQQSAFTVSENAAFAALGIEACRILDRPDAEYANHAMSKALAKAFQSQVLPLNGSAGNTEIFIQSEDKRLSVSSDANGTIRFSGSGVSIARSVVYIEPLHILDFAVDHANTKYSRHPDRYTADGFNMLEVLQEHQRQDRSVEEEKEHNEAMKIVRALISTIHGKIQKEGKKLAFAETIGNAEHVLAMSNIASGMKTMACIIRAIENDIIRKNSFLMIDEPESNLHPEWQIVFAKFLVDLCDRLQVKILLNTHSPYFLRAVDFFTGEDAALRGRCRFYQMHEDAGTQSGYFHSEERRGELNELYMSLYKPLESMI